MYIAWLDVGYFKKYLLNNKYYNSIHLFKVIRPPEFDETRVAYGMVFPAKMNLTRDVIFKTNLVHVSGGFLGTASVMPKWAHQYRFYTQKYMRLGLANSDQQVIYAMTVHQQDVPSVRIQTYKDNTKTHNPWYYLGSLCKIDIT